MKNPTLVVFLLFTGLLTVRAEHTAAPFHVDNIVLKSFQAIQAASGAKIVWEFTTEERDVTCNLEKSIDGINFVLLRSIFISSTRQQSQHTFVDRGASGPSFYRLRITKESYLPYISHIVSISLSRSGSMSSQNNLVIGTANASGMFGELSGENEVMCVRLVDVRGQAKIKQYIKGTDLDRVFRPSFSNLPAGYYVLSVNDMQNNKLLNRFIYKL